jgi:hypothetical protein
MNPLQAGIAAAREGRRAEARALLMRALQTNSRSEQAWLWMSAVVETDAERQSCLEQVLEINPHNQTAQLGLEKIKAGSAEGTQLPYLPISRPNIPQTQAPTAAGPVPPANPPARPPSAHSLPTLGMSPVESEAGRIRRLEPRPAPVDGLALLRSAQSQVTCAEHSRLFGCSDNHRRTICHCHRRATDANTPVAHRLAAGVIS